MPGDDIGSALITGGLSLLGGLFNNRTQKQINQQNIAMQRETNALQEKMFDKNLAWQKESQDIQNRYNSMEAQVERALAAGFSPAAILEHGATPAGNIAGGSPIPALTAPHAQMIQNPLAQGIEQFSSLAQSIAQLSESRYKDSQTTETLTLLNDKLKSIQLNNDAAEIANNLALQFGSKTKQAEYDVLVAEKAKKMSEVLLNEELSRTEKEKQFELVSSALLKDAQRALSKKEFKIFDEKWKIQKQDIKSRIALTSAQAKTEDTLRGARLANIQSDTAENRATAGYYNEMANIYSIKGQLDGIRRDLLTNQQTNEYGFPAPSVLEQLFNVEFRQQLSNLAKTDKECGVLQGQIDKLIQDARMAKKEADWYEVNRVYDMSMGIVDRVTDLAQFWKPKLSGFEGEVTNKRAPSSSESYEGTYKYENGSWKPVNGNKYKRSMTKTK